MQPSRAGASQAPQRPRQPAPALHEETSVTCDSASSSGGALHEHAAAADSLRSRLRAKPTAGGREAKKPRPLQLPTPGSPSSSSACASTPCPSPAYRCLFGGGGGGALAWSPAPACDTDADSGMAGGDSRAQMLLWLSRMESKSSSSDDGRAARLVMVPGGAGLPPPAFTMLGLLS